MDSVNFAEELIYNIQIDLWNIDILQPGEFVERLLCFPCNGIQDRMLALIRQAIHQFQSERSIMKYIYIIDKLIKVPNFVPAIHNFIIDIYSDLFMFLQLQRCSTEIQELKMLRKFWVGKLHPYCLSQIKEIIMQRANVDIDSGFKQEVINRIRTYYSSKLNMGPEEMAYHLPLLKKNEEAVRYSQNNMNNQRYVVETSSIFPQNAFNLNYTPNFNNLAFNAAMQPHSYPANSYTSKPPSSNQLRLQSSEVYPGENLKRKRLASQQTRVAFSGASQEGSEAPARKVAHRNEVIIDYKFMLSKLKRMNPYSCKECGLQFMTSDNHQTHRGEHFKEKLTKNDKNQRSSKTGKLRCVQEWVSDKSDLAFSLDQFYISIPKQEIQARLCHFCCAPLDMDFRNNQWIYTNAATVRINTITAIIHKSCQIALETEHDYE